MIYVKISLKNFNASLLMEELAGLPITSMGFAGFNRLTDRIYTPKGDLTQVGYSSNTGPDFASDGELRVSTSRDLTAGEESSLDALLLAHVSTTLTAEQQRQDQDAGDWTQMIADFPNWDAANNAQRMTMLKRAIRLIIRKERAAAI